MSADLVRIRNVGSRLARVAKTDRLTLQPVAFLIGACHALRAAIQLGWKDGLEKRAQDVEAYVLELRAVALCLEQDAASLALPLDTKAPSDLRTWSAGFFFGNALFRIAACAEALGIRWKMKNEPGNVAAIREYVNWFKHGLRKDEIPRPVSLTDALTALEQLADACEASKLIEAVPRG
jgi:hypothetical protein